MHHCVAACREVYHGDAGGLWRPRMVLTIHNLDNTGECRQDEFSFAGLHGQPYAVVRAVACGGWFARFACFSMWPVAGGFHRHAAGAGAATATNQVSAS